MKRFIRLFWYDFVNSIKCNRMLYVASIVLFVLGCVYFRGQMGNLLQDYRYAQEYEQKQKENGNKTEAEEETSAVGIFSEYSEEDFTGGNFVDYSLFLMRGMEKFEWKNKTGDKIDIPLMYIGFMILLSYLTGNYMFRNNGYHTVVRMKSRVAWLFSKIINNIINIFIIYLIALLTAWLFSDKKLGIHLVVCGKLLRIDRCLLDTQHLLPVLAVIYGLGFLGAVTIAQLQITVSLLTRNIAGFIVSVVIYILSLFYAAVYMPGNSCMVQRTDIFMEGGFSPVILAAVDIVLIAAAIVADIVIIRRKDMLE